VKPETNPFPNQPNPIPDGKSTAILNPPPKTENKNSVILLLLLAVAVIALLLYVAKEYNSTKNSSSEVNRVTVANPNNSIAENEKPTKQETIPVQQNPNLGDKKQTKQETPQMQETVQKSLTETLNDLNFDMIAIKGGTFEMGSTKYDPEKPIHTVTISDFRIGKTEVTQAQWVAVMGSNPSKFKGDNLPVEAVSWDDIQVFINKLNTRTGKTYRLPTEAEWEYAAGGGEINRSEYAGTDSESESNLGNYAWSRDNDNDTTHPVGTKQPNQLGLYDMSGNVWEWCSDWYGSYYYANSPQNNPKGPSNGLRRVLRGGGWGYSVSICRVSYRYSYIPDSRDYDCGFRLVCSF
jgi:formylglycine-generating enzyme required for sulfatase activity